MTHYLHLLVLLFVGVGVGAFLVALGHGDRNR